MVGPALHLLISALKSRATALCQHGDKLYIGLATGAIQVYSYDATGSLDQPGSSSGLPTVKLLKTHNLSRRSIDQIGVLPETDQLVVLSDSAVTLYSLPDLGKSGTLVLAQARTAHCFEIASYTARQKTTSTDAEGDSQIEAKRISKDLLVVGCRKKVIVYGLGKAGYKQGLELSLPHSPRTVVIPSSSNRPDAVHLLYSPTTSAVLRIDTGSRQPLSVTDVPSTPLPPPPGAHARDPSGASSSGGVEGAAAPTSLGGAFSGLGGYVGLGGKAAVPVGTRTFGGEVLLSRQDQGGFYSAEGNFTRQESIQWSSPPDALAFANPFIYSITSNPSTTAIPNPTSTVNIHLGPTLLPRASLTIPNPPAGALNLSTLVPSSTTPGQSPAEALLPAARLLFVATPTDKTLAQTEGSTIWAIRSGDVGEEVDELIKEGHVADAIGLVEAVGESGLAPSRRLPHLKILNAVCQFAKGIYQPAMDTFLVFNVNPARVISLFPADTISGPLHVPRDKWMDLFGAIEGARLEPVATPSRSATGDDSKSVLRMPHLGLNKKPSVDTLKQDAASVSSDGEKAAPPMTGEEQMAPRAALEALMFFLSDRRQKLTGAISSNGIPSEASLPPLSSLSASELHALPSIPLNELEPEQLLRMAQIIYTALLKVYLVARPILVGSLCRIENWCDVHEVEGLLKAQQKFGDLIDLYQGKKMHDKALTMLAELAREEDDPLDRYPPTVRYLQKLGPDYLQTIFDFSKWIFAEDPKRGVDIFTADEPEVEKLPRPDVVNFLAQENEGACIVYLEHVIHTIGDTRAEFHDQLAELYMSKAKKDETALSKLLEFLDTSQHYRANRLLSKSLKGQDLPRGKALLLGRMGQHDEALRIYVSRLQDYSAAEAYCSRIYSSSNTVLQDRSVFLLLLKIYLLPQGKDDLLVAPALSLLANHSTQLDAAAVLDLLPPLVTMEEIRSYLIRTLRDGTRRINDRKIIKGIVSSRKEEVERILMGLEVKRVRITDQRICPQCQKRLGQSAIAVHAPRGEVTHLHCKDPFSAKLAKIRG